MMIGTKFYRYVGNSNVPMVMRYVGDDNGKMILVPTGNKIIIETSEFLKLVEDKEVSILIRKSSSLQCTRYIPELNKREFWKLDVKRNKGLTSLSPDLNELNGEDRPKFLYFDITAGPTDTVDPDKVEEVYTKLTPDGYMTFSIIEYEGEKDVLVTLNKKDSKFPYAICRQNVEDIWHRDGEEIQTYGCSVTVENCPTSTFALFLDSDNISEFQARAVYFDDELNDILAYLKDKPYNDALKEISEQYMKILGRGCQLICKSLRQLLSTTNFYRDFCSCFGVVMYPDTFSLKTTSLQLGLVKFNEFMRVNYPSGYMYDNILYVPYDKSMDVDKIERKHMLVSTPVDKEKHILFVLTYDEVKL